MATSADIRSQLWSSSLLSRRFANARRCFVPVAAALGINALLYLLLAHLSHVPVVDVAEKPVPKVVLFEKAGSTSDPSSERQESAPVDVEVPTLREPVDPALTLAIPDVDPLVLPSEATAQGSASAGSDTSPRGVISANEADRPPRELSNAQPTYPRVALRRGIEGVVDLQLLIDVSGRVQRLEVVRVVGHESFRKAVMEVARRWRFSPALRHGHPTSVWAEKTIHFELD